MKSKTAEEIIIEKVGEFWWICGKHKPEFLSAMEEYATQSASQNNQGEGVEVTEQEACKIISSWDGEGIDDLRQLKRITFTGHQLFEFINHVRRSSPLPGTTVQGYSEGGEKEFVAGFRIIGDKQYSLYSDGTWELKDR